jgi:molybdopterin-guanine dinucleotide biosynthesis protein A/MOSC domain-containing protein YiiM
VTDARNDRVPPRPADEAAARTAPGRVEALCLSQTRGVVKSPVPQAEFRRDHGLVGDAHAGPWPRQVSVLASESIEAVRALIPDLADGAFAENVVVSGLDLGGLAAGDRLHLGAGVALEVTQIGKECHQGCVIQEITGDCIMPREGIFCRVVAGGMVEPGDAACLERRTGLVILAGGGARRFGGDKARHVWRGRRLVDRVADALAPLAAEIVVVVRAEQDEGGWPGDRVVHDDPALAPGPVRGLAAGLAAVSLPWAWAVACDAPCLEPALFRALRRGAAPGVLAVAPRWNGRLQTLAACYARDAAAPLRDLAAAGEVSLQAALRGLAVRVVEPDEWRRHDPAERSFVNVNTPDDLAALASSGSEEEAPA